MPTPKKKWITFRGNSTVPGEVLGKEKDQKQQAGEPVLLPSSYADHVVGMRLADFCDAPKKKSAPAKPIQQPSADLLDAEQKVADLQQQLADLGEGDLQHAAIKAQLDEAIVARDALKTPA